jgi:hypothetical protein
MLIAEREPMENMTIRLTPFRQKLAQDLDLWEVVAENMPLWGKVGAGNLKPAKLRHEHICAQV